MGLRTKFLIILIIFSVVPLLGFFLINQKLFDRLGDEVYHIAKVLLLQTAAKELEESADNYNRNLNRELNFIIEHVESLRDAIEGALVHSKTAVSQRDTLWIQEQVAEQLAIKFPGIKEYGDHLVSVQFFAEQGFYLRYPVRKETETITNPFQNIPPPEPDKPLWALPATGPGAPTTFKEQHIIAGLPVFRPDNSILGYIAIDFDFIKLFENIRPASQWSPYVQSFLLRMNLSMNAKSGLPLVIGIRNPLSDKAEWKASTFYLKIDPDFEGEATALFEGMQYGKEGYVSVPYEGEVSIWAYATAEIGLGILNILPEREVLFRIARHPERFSRWLSLDSLLIVSALVLVMVVIVALRSRRMLAPFFSMVSAFGRVSKGDFSTKLDFNVRDERQMIADAFNNMTIQLEDGMRMRQGLEVAKEVQHNFFPEIDADTSDLDIAVRMSYCEETGGDYIDVLHEKDGKVCIVVGDVTGHGVGAALLMATVRSLIRGRYEVDTDLSGVITSANSKLSADMGDSGRFVTLFIVEINPASRQLRWVRAGHDPAWLFRNTDCSIVPLSGPGVAMGVDCDLTYSENHRDQLESGDVILIGTDGIWETSGSDGTQFGKHRLERIVSENAGRTASEICDSLIDEVDQFRGDQKPEDDVSVVVIKIP